MDIGQYKHFDVVGFIVRKELTKSVNNYSIISSRIISIRIKASPINMTIIKVYAPTTSHADEEIEELYKTIEKTISDSPKKDFLIVQGDWNAIVGKDTTWNECVGRFGIGNINEQGKD